MAGAVTGITSGGSIVFIKGDNVWLTSPDGSAQTQVTTDGTQTSPYTNPTQSDDGNVIVAVRERNEQAGGFPRSYVYEMNRQGSLLRPAFAPDQYSTTLGGPCPIGVIDAPDGIRAAVSPDGTKVVVSPMERFYYSGYCNGQFSSYVYVMNLDGSTANSPVKPPAGSSMSYSDPTWVSNTRLIMYHYIEGAAHYYDLGAATALKWVAQSEHFPTLRGATLATSGITDILVGKGWGVHLWSRNGGPPAAPHATL